MAFVREQGASVLLRGVRSLTDIEAEERQAETQIKRLEADLREILPQIGYAMEAEESRDATVVQLPKPGK